MLRSVHQLDANFGCCPVLQVACSGPIRAAGDEAMTETRLNQNIKTTSWKMLKGRADGNYIGDAPVRGHHCKQHFTIHVLIRANIESTD